MKIFDFDPNIQDILNGLFSEVPLTNWKDWINTTSKEDYESLVLKLTELSSEDDLFNQLKLTKTDPKILSVNIESFLESYKKSDPVIFCHSSGTSGAHISDLKWFHMSESAVRRRWAPGIQAIYEASGAKSSSSAVFFVPSRIMNDGVSNFAGKEIVRIYSSEFSQRLMISILKPYSYFLEEYDKATNLGTIEKIFSMDNISIVSAPYSIILQWADLKKLRTGLKKSMNKNPEDNQSESFQLLNKIKTMGLDSASIEIQGRLSDVLSNVTLVFSISSMTLDDWSKIRKFMKWKNCAEYFTNLYVASEIGPFAANIGKEGTICSQKSYMNVLPLTLPVIESNGKRELITRSHQKIGKLLISYKNDQNPLLNIDTGDVIRVVNQEGIPRIGGEIFRSAFRLKTEVKFWPNTKKGKKTNVFVGDYFNLPGIEIVNPRGLLSCLSKKFNLDKNGSLVLKKELEEVPWLLIIPPFYGKKHIEIEDIQKEILQCPNGEAIENAFKNKNLEIITSNKNSIKYKASRSELLKLVREGKAPKGILKRWPLYVISPNIS